MLEREREHGELPSPICPGLTARSNRDLLFFGCKGILLVVVLLLGFSKFRPTKTIR